MKSWLATGCMLLAVGCGAEDAASDSSDVKAKTIAPGESIEAGWTTKTDGSYVVTVDCSPPSSPDDVGPVLSIAAGDLGVADDDAQTPRAGYWSWAGTLATVRFFVDVLQLMVLLPSFVSVTEKRTVASAKTCAGFSIHRSPNVHHQHIPVGKDGSADWEPLPASGNHWGAWAAWGNVYEAPVKRAFLLHNLEHGGAVLSYRCSGPEESSDCKAAEDALIALANDFGQGRVIVTPDPEQPETFAIRTWRWAYSSDCIDHKAALDFLAKHYRQGREDTDADPPIPFDPTTTDVPCQDLMAAPDSCN
jgi:hypothetical protein